LTYVETAMNAGKCHGETLRVVAIQLDHHARALPGS
jgi:hypothetical protein